MTLIHSRERLLPRDDSELAWELTELLQQEVLNLRLNFRVKEAKRIPGGWQVNDGEQSLRGDELLISLGRQANTQGLNLEAAGVVYDKSQIKVNHYLRTTAPNIWAAGDCIGGLRFSHIAEIEAKTAVRNALFPLDSRPDYQGAPWTTFTDPELAHLGLTEKECQEQGLKYNIYYQPFSGDDRAIADNMARGRAASGDMLLFLHADSFLAPGCLSRMESLPENFVGGAFTMQLTGKDYFYRFLSWGGNIYCRLTGTYFGDRGIFVRATTFKEMGGFTELLIMTEVDFSKRLRR